MPHFFEDLEYFCLETKETIYITFSLQWTFLGPEQYSIICMLFTSNEIQKLVLPEQRERSMQHTCQGNTCVPILLLTYAKITYFALGRISWPFLYHLSSTVGSASSTMNLTLPPLSTWYAGSRPLAKAVVEAKCYFNMRSENKNMLKWHCINLVKAVRIRSHKVMHHKIFSQ